MISKSLSQYREPPKPWRSCSEPDQTYSRLHAEDEGNTVLLETFDLPQSRGLSSCFTLEGKARSDTLGTRLIFNQPFLSKSIKFQKLRRSDT